MSQLGNVMNTYGKPFSIAVANTYSYNVMSANGLPSNTIILSAPVDVATYEDLVGTAVIVTDNNGEPVMLSKALKEGNGLVFKNDSLGLDIDNSTIKANDVGELYVDIASVIGDSTEIKVNRNGNLELDEDFIQKASATKFGVVKTDGRTIVSDGGTISVDTSKLDYATANNYGIAIGDNTTMTVNNGVPYVIGDGLAKASASKYGIMKPDNATIASDNGVLSVDAQSIVAGDTVGILKVDGTTIVSNNGVLSANTNALPHASTTTYGTVKLDANQFSIDADGTLHANSIAQLSSNVSSLQDRIQIANQNLDNIESEISSL